MIEDMSRRAWFGLPALLSRSRQESGVEPVPQGLVLSGGGSRAAFEIGALRYLYERTSFAPTTITATSAGAILGALLAQWPDRERQQQSLHQIEQLWLGMQRQADMFTERNWFAMLRREGPEWLKLVPWSSVGQPNHNRSTRGRGRASRTESTAAQELAEGAADDLGEVDPQQAVLAMALADESAEALSWSPSMMLHLVNTIPRIGRAGADLAAALNAAERSRSLYRPGPLVTQLLSPELFQASRIAGSGVRLRVAMVGLDSGELRYMREDGVLVDRADQPINDDHFDVSLGVLASCSMPGVFKPVEMDDEWYVDGGVRENIPLEIGIERLGMVKPYVIVAGAPGVPPADFASRDVVSIMLRVGLIQADESDRDEVAYARSVGAVVIEPELPLHDGMTVDPGLLAIDRDYGWLRAAEAVTQADEVVQRLHAEIIGTRLTAWQLETGLLARAQTQPADPPLLIAAKADSAPPDDLEELTRLKAHIRSLLSQADPALLPDHSERWWTGFEAHPGAASTPSKA